MRFAFVLTGFFAVLAAAESTSAGPPTSVAQDPAQASQAACLKACKEGDVNCQAHCIGVPSPDESQVTATTACVAKCPQGNGSAADTKVYTQCVDKCINANYFVTSEGTPAPTGAPGGNNAANSNTDTSATQTGSDASQTGSSDTTGSDTGAAPTGSSTGSSTKSSSSSGTKTGSAAASSTTNAAPAMIASGGTLFGVVAALLAL